MAKAKSATKYDSGTYLLAIIIGVLVIIMLFAMVWYKKTATAMCEPQNLQITAGQQSGAAGTIYQHINFTNTGKQRCTMSGYPTAFLYGADGYALGTAAAARPQPVPTTVTLDKGETASTTLGYPQAGNFNPGVCSAASTNLRVFVPGAISALELPLQQAWCPGFSATAIAAGS